MFALEGGRASGVELLKLFMLLIVLLKRVYYVCSMLERYI